MDKSAELILKAIILNMAKQEDSREFLHGMSQSLFSVIEEMHLAGDPVTAREISQFAELSRDLRDGLPN